MDYIKLNSFQVHYDTRVSVAWQEKGWCDEKVMDEWLTQQWKRACDGEMLLVLDVHRAQKTERILDRLSSLQTHPMYIPGGTTGLIQPLDVVVNAPFKAFVKQLADKHIHDNLDAYVQGTISAKERRVLFTKWVGEAWDHVCLQKESIIRSFRKCGISLPIDGSMDSEINIKGLESYAVGTDMDVDISDECNDPFDDIDSD